MKIESTKPLHIICTYKSPKHNVNIYIDKLQQYVKTVPHGDMCIIVGDFNSDLYNSEHNVLMNVMVLQEFHQHIVVPTTDHGSLLGHVYSKNINNFKSEVSDTYYSYHDLITIAINMSV